MYRWRESSARRSGCLWFERAKRGNDAPPAFGTPGLADIAAMQDQPVVGVAAIGRRRHLFQPVLHRARRFSPGEPGSVADAEDVGVDRDRLLPEGDVQDRKSVV